MMPHIDLWKADKTSIQALVPSQYFLYHVMYDILMGADCYYMVCYNSAGINSQGKREDKCDIAFTKDVQ